MDFPLTWTQALATGVLLAGFGVWLLIRKTKGHPYPSFGKLYPSIILLGIGGFIIKEVINSAFYIATLSPYPGENPESIRELVLIGTLGLGIHILMIVGHSKKIAVENNNTT